MSHHIVQNKSDWAEDLILILENNGHYDAASWLINYGHSERASELRANWEDSNGLKMNYNSHQQTYQVGIDDRLDIYNKMDSMTKSKLDDLKEEMSELFDENGKRYTATRFSDETAEQMLAMILELEKHISSLI